MYQIWAVPSVPAGLKLITASGTFVATLLSEAKQETDIRQLTYLEQILLSVRYCISERDGDAVAGLLEATCVHACVGASLSVSLSVCCFA